MNPVVGIDVAKGESETQAFVDKGKPYGKNFSIKHNRDELDRLVSFLGEIETITGKMPVVILESTGHYLTPIIQCLEENVHWPGIPFGSPIPKGVLGNKIG